MTERSSSVASLMTAAALAGVEQLPAQRSTSYAEILKSSALIGSSSLISLLFTMARTKAIAVILGPAGLGLMGLYTSVVDIVRHAAEIGINSSGVRQIAAAEGSGDQAAVALTVLTLRRSALVLGVMGALLMVLLAKPLSTLTFGDDAHAAALSLLSLAVFLRLMADAQGALLQGQRRIGDLARVSVFGAAAGAVGSVAVVYWLREEGVVPALLIMAAASLLASWWYSRTLRLDLRGVPARRIVREALPLLKLGAAFMASGLLTTLAAYLVRLFLVRHDGLVAAGHFQAAWAIGGLYVGFVLQAMGADFYPRLVAVAADNAECNRLVNEQARVSLLLAGTGIVGTLTFAPWVVTLLYSAEFGAAVDTLRWICLGMALRVVSWPLGYIIIAKGRQLLFFGAELAWAAVNVVLTWFCVEAWGLFGASVAFLLSYVFHVALVWAIARRLCDFRWTPGNHRTLLLFVALLAAVQAAFEVLPSGAAFLLGIVATAASGWYSLAVLGHLVPREHLPAVFARVLRSRQERR